MPKKSLIVQNISHEGPGMLEDILNERKLSYDIVDLHQRATFPAPTDYSALIVMGGPDSANDHTQKMLEELERIREALDNMPYLGICLGLQTGVKAGGGNVVKNVIPEIGFRGPDGSLFEAELTPDGKSDPLFKGFAERFRVFQLHGETVEPTQDMSVLATGKFCRNQVVKFGPRAYGIQAHVELTPAMFEEWITKDSDLKQLDPQSLRRDFEMLRTEYQTTCRRMFENFLRIAGI